MAGVASPMLRRTRSGASRFLIGLVAGGAAAGLLLSLPAYLIGTVLHDAVPMRARIVILAVLLAILAIADLTRRTPHVWRQVPQDLVWKLPPGSLGVAWGFDLGLLFTTQKTTSLVWVAIAAVVLTGPWTAAVLLVSVALMVSLTIALWSVLDRSAGLVVNEHIRRLQGLARQGSGMLIAALLAATVLQAWRL